MLNLQVTSLEEQSQESLAESTAENDARNLDNALTYVIHVVSYTSTHKCESQVAWCDSKRFRYCRIHHLSLQVFSGEL